MGSLATILVPSSTGFARGGSMHKSPERKADITFNDVVKLRNGVTLPVGTYRIEVPEDTQTPTVTFSRGGKVVATSSASLVSEEKKNSHAEFDTVRDGNTLEITEIRPEGWSEALDSAGINRHGVVNERVIQGRSSEPPWPPALRGRS